MPDFTMQIYDETVPGWVAHYPRPAAHTHPISEITNLQTTLDGKIIYNDVLMPTNTFGGKKLYINSIDNAMHAADKKWFVEATRHLKSYGGETYPKLNPDWVAQYTLSGSGTSYTITNNPKPSSIVVFDGSTLKYINTHYTYNSGTGVITFTYTPTTPNVYPGAEIVQYLDSPVSATLNASTFFDGNYETTASTATVDYYIKVRITPRGNLYDTFITDTGYAYGSFYLSYYYAGTPEKASDYRVYNYSYQPHGIGWKKLTTSDYIGSIMSTGYVQSVNDGSNHGRSIIEFIIYGKTPHSGTYQTSPSQIDWRLDRPSLSKTGATVTKYGENKLYSKLYFGNQTENKITLDPAGIVTSLDFKIGSNSVYHPGNKPSMSDLGGRTQAEITSEIASALAALIDSSPDALNTLNEFSIALGNDPNFATTITNALASKLNNNNPVFTGIMVGPDIRGTDVSHQFWIRNQATSPTAQIQLTDENAGTIYFWASVIEIDGSVNMNSNIISYLGTPVNDGDATTKLYVDTGLGNKAPLSHNHGNITDGGEITADDPIGAGDKLVFSDSSNNGKLIAMPSSLAAVHNGEYLRRDGTWTVPPDTNTTYGAFVGATVSLNGSAGLVPQPLIANRLQFLRGDGAWGLPSKSDVGLGSVYNYGLATTEQAEEGAVNTVYMTPVRVKEAIQNINPTPYFGVISTSQTLNINHANRFIRCTNSSAITITIPLGVYQIGDEIHILRAGAGEVTITNATSVSIYSEGSATANAGRKRINAQMQVVTLKMYASNLWQMFGALKT